MSTRSPWLEAPANEGRTSVTTPDRQSLVALVLTSHLVVRDVKPLKSSQFWALLERVDDLEELVGESPRGIQARAGVPEDQAAAIHQLLEGAASFAFELEDLHRRGINVLSALDERYPGKLRTKLGPSAPPVLYVAGSIELMTTDGIGMVGARDVSPEAARVAHDAARLLAAHGLTVFSGAAKGIDQVAMNAAFDAGGAVVGILADSLDRRLRDPDTRRAIHDDRVCLVTPYKPSMGFTVANAMARNKLIYAFAKRTLVVQSDLEKGGTWAGATEWLKRSPADVAVWSGPGEGKGNRALIEAGARAITEVEELVHEPAPSARVAVEQLGFGV